MKCLLFLLFLPSFTVFLANQTFAQNMPAYPSVESMGLVRSIQHPVNHTSGLLNVQVPLHSIEYNGITVPIALSYHASGIKVEDRPGILGMGWNLIAGGKITRVIRQYPDDHYSKPYTWGNTLPEEVCRALYHMSFYDHLLYQYYKKMDTEPDLFYFEIPGRSGMFVLDASGKPQTIPYQNIFIEPQWEGIRLSSFIIKDEQGNVYMLGNSGASKESTEIINKNSNLISNNGQETINYVSTWHLNSIGNYTGSLVEFTYEDGKKQNQDITNFVYSAHYNGKNWEFDTEEIQMKISTSPKYLSSIKWGNEKIDFSYSYGFCKFFS